MVKTSSAARIPPATANTVFMRFTLCRRVSRNCTSALVKRSKPVRIWSSIVLPSLTHSGTTGRRLGLLVDHDLRVLHPRFLRVDHVLQVVLLVGIVRDELLDAGQFRGRAITVLLVRSDVRLVAVSR